MTLVKFKPNLDMFDTFPTRRFSDLIDSIFDEALVGRRPMEGNFLPEMDVRETESAYEIEVALPGMQKENIKIDLEDRVLTISGERKSGETREGVRYHLVESRYGRFSRSITMPGDINRETVQAFFNEGILRVTIEKDEKAVAKQIEIR